MYGSSENERLTWGNMPISLNPDRMISLKIKKLFRHGKMLQFVLYNEKDISRC